MSVKSKLGNYRFQKFCNNELVIAIKIYYVYFMDADILSRIQFALTAGFHFIFPPITIGFSIFLVIVEFMWIKTNDKKYLIASKFFAKLFAMLFAVGVATGLIMIFQFGTNWATYSQFVGDVFGSPLAIEAVFAFFMESTFLAIVLFGWNKIGKKAHIFATIMVCIGSHLSAIWIIAANSFMQTPDGYTLVIKSDTSTIPAKWIELPKDYVVSSEEAPNMKAQITDFWAMALNNSTLDRFTHTVCASWLSGSLLAAGICSYYILRRRKESIFAIPCLKIALCFAGISSLAVLFTGHSSAVTLLDTQPEKLAAFEAQFETEKNAPLYIFGIVDEAQKKVHGLKINGLFSLLTYGKFDVETKGLNSLPPDDFIRKAEKKNLTQAEIEKIRPSYHPPVQFCFQTFRIMVYIGTSIFALLTLGFYLWYKKKLTDLSSKLTKIFMILTLPSCILPILASQFGWAAAEVGRQPWIVWRILKTSDAISKNISGAEVLFSIILFCTLFLIVSGIFCIFFFKKIKNGTQGDL